jgi:hypothetical protein
VYNNNKERFALALALVAVSVAEYELYVCVFVCENDEMPTGLELKYF